MVRKVIPMKWSLAPENQHKLWNYWKNCRPAWVEGEYDGTLSWTLIAVESIGESINALQELFFGFGITEKNYAAMIRYKLIPPGLIPEIDRHVEKKRLDEQQTGIKIVKPLVPFLPVKPKVKRKPKGQGPSSKHTFLILALRGLLELGRASRTPEGAWTVIEWEGVEKKRQANVPTVKEALEWLQTIEGVTKIVRKRRPSV
jgi:hypothetical protein